MASARVKALFGACMSCQVNQCCCCSLKSGVIFISLMAFVNACFAFAGEAVLYFDMAAAIISQVEGRFLPTGMKLNEDGRVHGGLIFAGLYSLFISFVGIFAVARKSARAAAVLTVLTVLNTFFAITIVIIVWFVGALSFTQVLSQLPGAVVAIYLCIVCNSYRKELRGGASATAGGNLPPMSRSFDDGVHTDGRGPDEYAVTDSEVAVSVTDKAPTAGRRGPQIAIDDDDDDGDLGRGGKRV